MMVSVTDDWADVAFDGEGNLHDLLAVQLPPAPPDVVWTATELEEWALTDTVADQPVVIAVPDGVEQWAYETGLRAAGDIWIEDEGRFVLVVPEVQWRQWHDIPEGFRPERPRRARAVSTRTAWVWHEASKRGVVSSDDIR